MGEVQFLSYWTLIGRIDQFILGIVAFHLRHLIIGRTLGVALIAISFSIFWLFFDSIGGYYNVNGNNLNSLFWIFIPTIEAIVYGVLISWYDNSIRIRDGVFSKFIARIGTYSYSIYLLHYFLVFELPIVIHENLMDLSNPYLVLMISVPCFFLMLPISYLSHKVIEAPFLKYRRRYIFTR